MRDLVHIVPVDSVVVDGPMCGVGPGVGPEDPAAATDGAGGRDLGAGSTWSVPELGIRIGAPPPAVGPNSSARGTELADRALEAGIASSRYAAASPVALIAARARSPVSHATARTIPPGRLVAVMPTCALFIRHHSGVLAALAIGVAVATVSGQPVIAHGLVIIALVLLSVLVHELGHLVAYRILTGPDAPVILSCVDYRAFTVRRGLDPRADAVVSAAGPLAPGALTLAVLPLAATPIGPLLAPELAAGIILGLAHLGGFLLPGGDRDALRAAAARRGVSTGKSDPEGRGQTVP